MIGIKLQGDSEYLELPPDVSINVKLENPILGDPEKISPGSFSFPFDIHVGDLSPKNAVKLKHQDVIENSEAYNGQDADLFYDGIPFKRGVLKSKSGNKNKRSAYFTFGLNTISPAFKKAKLRSILSETIIISSDSVVKKVYVKKISAGDFTVIINGTSYTYPNTTIGIGNMGLDTSSEAFTKTLDQPDQWYPKTVLGTGTSPGGITGTYFFVKLVQYFTVSPGVYNERDCEDPLQELHVTLQPDADLTDYQVEADIAGYTTDFSTFVNSYISVTPPTEKIRFPVVFNANLYGESIKQGEGINLMDSGGLIVNDPNWGFNNSATLQIRNYNSIQPFIRLKYVLDKIATYFGFTWTGDFYTDMEVDNMLLWNSAPLDVAQKFIGETKFVFWKRSFDISELVPDITVVEFLKRLQSRYNLGIFYNEPIGQVQISFREPIAKSLTYEDITPLCSPIEADEDQRVDGYFISIEKDSTDALSAQENLTVGTAGEEPINITCGRLFGEGVALVEDEAVSGPRVSQKQGENGMMRIFHYTGIISNTGYDYAGAAISGPGFTETLSDIYTDYHLYWLFFQRRRVVVKLKCSFPLRSLLNFNFELKRRFDRNTYLVKSIEAKLRNSGIEVSSVELMTLQ